jgi:MYXO-CTERM domain-containing protein
MLLKSEVISIHAIDKKKPEAEQKIKQLNLDNFLIELPYEGESNDGQLVSVLTSTDGQQWSVIPIEDILLISPQTEKQDGFVIIQSNKFGSFVSAIKSRADNKAPGTDLDETDADNASSSDSGGSQSPWLLLLLSLAGIALRKKSLNHAVK